MSVYSLICQSDNKKNFSGHAIVEINNGIKTLISYKTEVAHIINNHAYITGFYSRTTTRHIKEFLSQEGFKAINKDQMNADYFISMDSKKLQELRRSAAV